MNALGGEPVQFILNDHVEAPREQPPREVFEEVLALAELGDQLGFAAIWFAEHHFHVHLGHLPAPILLALAAAQRTRRIAVGAAIVCLNLYHPLAIAEQVAVVDVLANGRTAFGYGSGATAAEFKAFGLELSANERRARFAEALDIMAGLWSGRRFGYAGRFFQLPEIELVPAPLPGLLQRSWVAANSTDSAAIAGERGFGLMVSRERSLDELRAIVGAYLTAYHRAGAPGVPRVSASMGVYVGESDVSAEDEFAPTVRAVWERARREGRLPATAPLPASLAEAAEQVSIVYGGPERCTRAIASFRQELFFTHFHLRLRWDALPVELVRASLRRFAAEVMPAFADTYA